MAISEYLTPFIGKLQSNIFNANETGLLFNCLPDHTLISEYKKMPQKQNTVDRVSLIAAFEIASGLWSE